MAGQSLSIVSSLHRATRRDYLHRMVDEKEVCMERAKEYAYEYWDGDRRYGYGGYSYIPGRWQPVAQALIDTYNLRSGSKVLDIGCGKGYLLHEMKLLEPNLEICGLDISEYGLAHAKKEIRPFLFKHKAQDQLPFEDLEFDLVISLATFHNLQLFDLQRALCEMERVGRQKYLVVESYRNDRELFNLQCWALTCESFFDCDEWIWIYEQYGFKGDYEFIFFE